MEIIWEFTYFDVNRRMQCPAIERILNFDAQELTAVRDAPGDLRQRLSAVLASAGIVGELPGSLGAASPEDPRRTLGDLYLGLAVLLQRHAGHEVNQTWLNLDDNPGHCSAAFQCVEIQVGTTAADIALILITRACPSLVWKTETDTETKKQIVLTDITLPIEHLVSHLVGLAQQLVEPAISKALRNVALQAGVPCSRLDYYPFEPARGDYRIRANSALALGQCRLQHIVDGTFCIDRCGSLTPLLKERRLAIRYMGEQLLQLPAGMIDVTPAGSPTRAARNARKLGYPLVMVPAVRGVGRQPMRVIYDEAELRAELTNGIGGEAGVLLEPYVNGPRLTFLFANRKLLGVYRREGPGEEAQPISPEMHQDLHTAIMRVVDTLDVGMLALTAVSKDISAAPSEGETVFVDLDIAPELDTLIPSESPRLVEAARGLFEWLYPPGSASRVPLVAVTGTNGKTTTSRMIHTILREAGRAPGLVCTDGVLNQAGQLLEAGDLAGLIGHFRILNSQGHDCAVLETARGAVLTQGFAFDHCDVAVCLNVERDHIGDAGIDTLQEMAALKRSIVARARGAVVLNADCPLCIAMLPFPDVDKVCLVSIDKDRDALGAIDAASRIMVLVETAGNELWIVIHDDGERIPVIAVKDIPATFGNSLRCNTSNAVHACAATYLMGVAADTICAALCHFEMSYENTPGRFNRFEELPFSVLMDYAHNAHSFEGLCQYLDTCSVAGRKIVMFSAVGDRTDEDNREAASRLAGHFDHYVCRNYMGVRGGHEENHLPNLLKSSLRDAGVPEASISVVPDAAEAIQHSLALAAAGDLLVLLVGSNEFSPTWEMLKNHEPSPPHS